jgi:RND superfamily putative drug exporter
MLTRLSDAIYRRAWLVLAAGVLFMVLGGLYGPGVFGQLKNGGFADPASESTQVQELLRDHLGRPAGSLVVLFTAPAGSDLTVDSPTYRAAVETTLARIAGQEGVESIASFYTVGAPQLVSTDRRSTFAAVGVRGDEGEQEEHFAHLRPLLTSDTLQVRLGGSIAVGAEMNAQVERDIARAETFTFPILAILLLIVFGSAVAAGLPLLVGALSILGAFLVVRLIAGVTDVSIFAVNIITILGLGLGVDYSLFVISRFREELERQEGDVAGALRRTMQTAGRTVIFSGLTVALSLLGLLVFPFMFLRSMGLGAAAAVLVAMLTSITLLPAILALLGRRINALSLTRLFRRNSSIVNRHSSFESGFWYRTTRLVMRRPGIVLAATLIPLLLAGTPFLRAQFAIPDYRSLPAGAESRLVSEVLVRDFPRNETTPVEIVVRTSGAATDPVNIGTLYDYTRRLAAVPGVRRVDSLATLDPNLDRAAYQALYTPAGLAAQPQAAQLAARLASGEYTLVTILYDADPLSDAAQRLVTDLRAVTPPVGLTAQVGGVPAQLVDFLASLGGAIPGALALIAVVIFGLLFLMLGSIVVPLKAILLNILSLSASFGALVWIFQDGNLSGLLNFTPTGALDGTQPVLIFAIAFGLSMDYEVFLLSRIKEAYDRTGDMANAVATGVQRTGSIITSAALLLFVVIAAFASGEITFIKQIGVGLGLAIIVDATVVRMFLVPATMRLMGEYNWWAPRPLLTLYERLGLAERDDEPSLAAGTAD